ncbi:helix-turn-helix transcriptional regulator [Ottowia thiooxydans]|uniref:helix-turn-helix transcriptional regulator n=1 Tax=Ottowia thiooxydans TaxID=219182 RepID=UPI00041ABAC7|nr:helix-turn-helix transcriptional regulator [Ottowia thiooxydans]
MSHPLPQSLLTHLRTDAWEPSVRRDAWKEIAHPWVGYEPMPGVPLEAEMDILRGSTCATGSMRSSAYDMRTGPRWQRPEDMVVISLIQSGEMLPGLDAPRAAGGMGLCATRRAGHFRWTQGTRYAFIALRHCDVQAALGREPPASQSISTARCALAPVLASHMNHLTPLLRQRAQVNDAEYADLLDATRALALLMLRNLGRQGESSDLPDTTESLHSGRRAAALRFMELHAHRPELSAAEIAHGAGCSRTRLYEAFAARNGTVMDALREMRLQRARNLIEQSQRLNVGAIAWRCGFASPSGFSKLFRLRFGLTPTEWHLHAQTNTTG